MAGLAAAKHEMQEVQGQVDRAHASLTAVAGAEAQSERRRRLCRPRGCLAMLALPAAASGMHCHVVTPQLGLADVSFSRLFPDAAALLEAWWMDAVHLIREHSRDGGDAALQHIQVQCVGGRHTAAAHPGAAWGSHTAAAHPSAVGGRHTAAAHPGAVGGRRAQLQQHLPQAALCWGLEASSHAPAAAFSWGWGAAAWSRTRRSPPAVSTQLAIARGPCYPCTQDSLQEADQYLRQKRARRLADRFRDLSGLVMALRTVRRALGLLRCCRSHGCCS